MFLYLALYCLICHIKIRNDLEIDFETQIRHEKWIPRILEPIKSGITQDFVSNRSPSIKNTNTDGGHIGFIANRPPEVAHKLLAMVS